MQSPGPLVVFGPQPWDMAYPFHTGTKGLQMGREGKESSLEVFQALKNFGYCRPEE